MTAADIKMVKAMLTIIRDSAKEKNEDNTAEQIDTVIQVLDEQIRKTDG